MGIISYPACGGPWTDPEHGALVDLQYPLEQAGLEVDLTTGVSDKGDAWAAIANTRDGRCLLHVTRTDLGVVLIWCDGVTVRARSLSNLVNALRCDPRAHVASLWEP